MELIKLNEAYTIIDDNEKWMTSGNVTKEMNGCININFFTTLRTDLGEGENRWGSLYYSVNPDGGINASYNFEGSYKEDFVDYAEGIVAQILEEIK